MRNKLYVAAVARSNLQLRPRSVLDAYGCYHSLRRTPRFQPTFMAYVVKGLGFEVAILGTYLDTMSHNQTLILLLRVYSLGKLSQLYLDVARNCTTNQRACRSLPASEYGGFVDCMVAQYTKILGPTSTAHHGLAQRSAGTVRILWLASQSMMKCSQ